MSYFGDGQFKNIAAFALQNKYRDVCNYRIWTCYRCKPVIVLAGLQVSG